MTKHVDLRLPDDLAERIDKRAATVGLSRNAWLVKALEWALAHPTTVNVKQEV